eukprot:32676-Lingulodinium_polyedra.AAC.1
MARRTPPLFACARGVCARRPAVCRPGRARRRWRVALAPARNAARYKTVSARDRPRPPVSAL